MIPALNDKEMETILETAVAAGADAIVTPATSAQLELGLDAAAQAARKQA